MRSVQALISPEEATVLVCEHVQPGRVRRVPLREALHRTLASEVRCDVDYPPFDRSLMDGYAVRSADVSAPPTVLTVVGDIAAGREPARGLGSGEAMRINTGAPIPAGADAVVRIEDTEPLDARNSIRILKGSPPGHFITPRGSYIRAGKTSLPVGTRLGPIEIAVAATSGATQLSVYAAPRVGILATGDELIDIHETPEGAAIRNSNQWLLEALVREAHAEPAVIGSVRDHREAIRSAVIAALSHCDALCLTGGVSMGEFDFVPGVLTEVGCQVHFHKVAIKPGRPSLFATSPAGQPVFGLPGNPISAFIGFHLFVTVALARMQGRAALVRPTLPARLRGRLPETGARCSFVPAALSRDEAGGWAVTPLRWQGSGDPFGMVGADGLIERATGSVAVEPGAMVTVRPLPHWTGS